MVGLFLFYNFYCIFLFSVSLWSKIQLTLLINFCLMDYNERYHKSDQEVIAEQAIIEQSKENPRAFEKVYNAYN